MNRQQVSLVVFDIGGTTVDHGCMAPVIAVVEAFKQMQIEVSHVQARGPMGLHKRDHVRAVLEMPGVHHQWSDKHGRDWDESDVQQIYEQLVSLTTEIALRHTDLVPGALDCGRWLRSNQIAMTATTGYPRVVAQPILDEVLKQGLQFDMSICADEVPAGRPAPWMIFRCMESTNVYPTSRIVKVGDTVPDMQAAHNAGVWAIGVSETGSEFGLDVAELAAMSATDRDSRHDHVEEKLRNAGAHFVIRSLNELPTVLESRIADSQLPR